MTQPTGRNILTLARTHIGERYVLGASVPKDNANWTGPWDCAEFTSWLVFQLSGRLYGCYRNTAAPSAADAYTGYWARDAGSIGRKVPTEEAAAIPGAFVLRVPAVGLTGHVAVSDGAGGTVEAHSSQRGVIAHTLKNRRWDYGILPPPIEYGAAAPPARIVTPASIYRLTKPDMQGPEVRAVQRKLKELGFHPGPIDGVYGPMTARAAAAFQLSNGLIADGEVGPLTLRALGLTI